MGNSQSLFYPDNPKRRTRAQQLADDCEAFKNDYEKIKAEVEAELGPYKEKVYHVMHAFGCRNLDDLDKLVCNTAVGESLEQWKQIKSTVDNLDTASEVFSTAMAVVAIAGLAISAVGALAGGFGFFVGLAVTSDILLILGVIGVIFDAISGAVQRSQLQDAINSLYPARIKIKYLLEHSRLIQINISSVKMIYTIFERKGYDRNAIIQELRKADIMQGLQQGDASITYYEIAKSLVELDRTRPGGAWTNEDPRWEGMARSLDWELAARKQGTPNLSNSAQSLKMAPRMLAPTNQSSLASESEMHVCDHSLRRLEYMKDHNMEYVLRSSSSHVYESRITITLEPKQTAKLSPLLHGSLNLDLRSYADEISAVVHLGTVDGDSIQADIIHKSISVGQTAGPVTEWTISFINSTEAARFISHLSSADPMEPLPRSVEVFMRVNSPSHLYLAVDGSLTADMLEFNNTFLARYACTNLQTRSD